LCPSHPVRQNALWMPDTSSGSSYRYWAPPRRPDQLSCTTGTMRRAAARLMPACDAAFVPVVDLRLPGPWPPRGIASVYRAAEAMPPAPPNGSWFRIQQCSACAASPRSVGRDSQWRSMRMSAMDQRLSTERAWSGDGPGVWRPCDEQHCGPAARSDESPQQRRQLQHEQRRGIRLFEVPQSRLPCVPQHACIAADIRHVSGDIHGHYLSSRTAASRSMGRLLKYLLRN
jgi:hypothetical protein